MDLDGCLCIGTAWTPEECLTIEANPDVLAWLKEIHLRHFVVIYTARRDALVPATLEWLRKNNIPYSAFSNQKMPADIYIDDKAHNVVDLTKLSL